MGEGCECEEFGLGVLVRGAWDDGCLERTMPCPRYAGSVKSVVSCQRVSDPSGPGVGWPDRGKR